MKIKAKVFKNNVISCIKGTASITIEDSIVISDLKIMEGKNGIFISMPNRKLKNGTYKDIAFPITREAREQITNEILKEYNNDQEQEETPLYDDFPF